MTARTRLLDALARLDNARTAAATQRDAARVEVLAMEIRELRRALAWQPAAPAHPGIAATEAR